MPLPKYSVEPVNICNVPVPKEVESELEYLSNVTLCNLMRQMSSICQLAGSMFEELTKELNNTTERAMRLQKRIQKLSTDAQPLKAADEDCTLGASGVEVMEFQSKKPTSSQVLNKNTIPMSMRNFYEAAEPAPPIHIMDLLRDDGRIGMKMYSDPSFFFDLWSHEMLQAPNKVRKPKKKKPKTKSGKASKTSNNETNNDGGIQIQQQGLGGIVEHDYNKNYNAAPHPGSRNNGAVDYSYQDGYVTPSMPLGAVQNNQLLDQYCFIQPGFNPAIRQVTPPSMSSNHSRSTLSSTPMPLPQNMMRSEEGFNQSMQMHVTPIDTSANNEDLPPAPLTAANGSTIFKSYMPVEDEITPSPPPPPIPGTFVSQEDSFHNSSSNSLPQWNTPVSSSLGNLISNLAPANRQSLGSTDYLLPPPPPAPIGIDQQSASIVPSPLPPTVLQSESSKLPMPIAPPAPPPPNILAMGSNANESTLKPVPTGPPQDLLSAIRAGMVLRKVSDSKPSSSVAQGNTGTLSRNRDVQAIFDAVIRRRQMMKKESDSESDSDDDSEKSSGWSD